MRRMVVACLTAVTAAALLQAPERAAAQRSLVNYESLMDRGTILLDSIKEIEDWIQEWPGSCITPERLAELQADYGRWSDQYDSLLLHDDTLERKVVGRAAFTGKQQTGNDRLNELKADIRVGMSYLKQHVCKPNQTSYTGGGYLGGELVKNSGWLRSTEIRDATGVTTNQFTDRADPVGGGLIVGYKFAPWSNRIVVSPFASFDFINAPVNHSFANGSYLGTTANFMGTWGLKIGPQIGKGVWLYGIAGVSALNETMKISFIPTYSSQSAWVAGATAGVGAAWKPDVLQGLGRPVSLFAEYQHTWWQDATFNAPTASPLFNYTFARQDDMVKLGVTVDLSAPPSPTAATMYRKTSAAK